MKEFLERVIRGESLDSIEAEHAMDQILSEESSDVQIASFLTALRIKGETESEVSGFVRSLRQKAVRVEVPDQSAVDLCGTGGDESGTFNVSTAAAFVVAGAGQSVVKHGNRSVSSRSGSSDVLEALGIASQSSVSGAEEQSARLGLSFLFAPAFHPALKRVASIRRSIGVRTVFNLLGPMLNPARVRRQVIGVYSKEVMGLVAGVLRSIEAEKALVVHGEDGLDEISICAPTLLVEVSSRGIFQSRISPEDFGLRMATAAEIRGSGPEENAKIIMNLLDGQPGAPREIVLLNAAAGLYVGDSVKDLQEGVQLARQSIDSGAALSALKKQRGHDVAG